MSNFSNAKTDVTSLIDTWSEQAKDEAYRYLWLSYVKTDVISHAEDELEDITLTDDEVELIARRYVYEGDYDCNLSYWQNLDNLIDETIRAREV